MSQREQLALIGESDNQMHFTSVKWGLLTFFPTKTNLYKDTCYKCLLKNSDECADTPCHGEYRADGKNGYYSIHDMPNK